MENLNVKVTVDTKDAIAALDDLTAAVKRVEAALGNIAVKVTPSAKADAAAEGRAKDSAREATCKADAASEAASKANAAYSGAMEARNNSAGCVIHTTGAAQAQGTAVTAPILDAEWYEVD